MILQISPDAPLLLRAAATSVLVLHVGAGGVGLLSGAAAMTFRKGERLHRAAGNVFFAAMLTMSAIGASVAPFLPQRPSIFAGVFTFYLVATAWATVRRREDSVGVFEVGALLVALATAVGFFLLGWEGAQNPRGMLDGAPYQPSFVFGAAATLAAALDLRLILRGGIAGAPRIARHLWRMCLALFIASASLFLGQPQVFPPPLHGSPILFVPALAPLVLLAFWMLRVRFTRAFRREPIPVGVAASA